MYIFFGLIFGAVIGLGVLFVLYKIFIPDNSAQYANPFDPNFELGGGCFGFLFILLGLMIFLVIVVLFAFLFSAGT